MRKRMTACLLAALSTTILLAGCGASEQDSASAATSRGFTIKADQHGRKFGERFSVPVDLGKCSADFVAADRSSDNTSDQLVIYGVDAKVLTTLYDPQANEVRGYAQLAMCFS